LILADVGRDWTLASSVETFAIPVGLFIVIAATLFFLYTRPHAVPGHRDLVPAQARAGGAGAAGGRTEKASDTGDGS